MRRVAGCLLLILPLTLAACSDDDDSSDADASASGSASASGTTPTSEDSDAYCEAIREATDLVSEFVESGEVPPQETQDEFLDLWAEANAAAPSEIAAAAAAVMNDPSATAEQETINTFNEETCGVDTAALNDAMAGSGTTSAP
jgi:hypothetical protein